MDSQSESVDSVDEVKNRSDLLKYACQLTMDPNTAHGVLTLSDGNKKVALGPREHAYQPNNPGRFDCWPQVLCRESLSGQCYWEVEWRGKRAEMGVAYRDMSRKEDTSDCRLGGNDKSWMLCCTADKCTAYHNKKATAIQEAPSSRVGLYLDWAAGILSFYSVSFGKLVHLHTFRSAFAQPLHAGFGVYTPGCFASVCRLQD